MGTDTQVWNAIVRLAKQMTECVQDLSGTVDSLKLFHGPRPRDVFVGPCQGCTTNDLGKDAYVKQIQRDLEELETSAQRMEREIKKLDTR
jgi:hypothetical protein